MFRRSGNVISRQRDVTHQRIGPGRVRAARGRYAVGAGNRTLRIVDSACGRPDQRVEHIKNGARCVTKILCRRIGAHGWHVNHLGGPPHHA